MQLQETITIINNSGKIISTGKHLVNLFKDAKAAYKDKKDALKAERAATAPVPGITRAKTFDVTPRGPPEPYYEYGYNDQVYSRYDDGGRRYSQDDMGSHASSRRSQRSRRSAGTRPRARSSSRHRPALTETNLKTLSEVSSTAPSKAPRAYRSPYAETLPLDMTLSRPTLAHAATLPVSHSHSMYTTRQPPTVASPTTMSPVSTPRQSMLVNRSTSDPSLHKKPKEIDLNLAYGNIPPDLASRVDLDPEYAASPEGREAQARNLMQRIDGMLEEAECVQHSATAIIAHLQSNPEAAAAVALTLAELSGLIAKMSPAFLGIIKGGSPAIFALLASPQFLIAAGVTVGVTIVMFGGWKIVKRIRESKREREEAFAAQQAAADAAAAGAPPSAVGPAGAYIVEPSAVPAGYRQGAMFGQGSGFDEALVLEEELSTIETWRRGIVPFGEEEGSVDAELISPEANRRRRQDHDEEVAPGDSISSVGRTRRSHHGSKSHKSHHSSRRHSDRDGEDIPERKSSKGFQEKSPESSKDKERGSEAGDSERSHRSHRSSRSKRPERVEPKAIEDGSRQEENTLDMVLRPKEKKNMLKTLFQKKKQKEDTERDKQKVAVSVLV